MGVNRVCGVGECNIGMRFLPCPCKYCYANDFDDCTNKDIVGEMCLSEITFIPPVECPGRVFTGAN